MLGMPPDELAEAHARLSAAVHSALDRSSSEESRTTGMVGPAAKEQGSMDMFLVWISGLLGRTGAPSIPKDNEATALDLLSGRTGAPSIPKDNEATALDLLSSLSRSPACEYWWPAYGRHASLAGSGSSGDRPRLLLCDCLQLVLRSERPCLMAACEAEGWSPACHLAAKLLDASFFGYLTGK